MIVVDHKYLHIVLNQFLLNNNIIILYIITILSAQRINYCVRLNINIWTSAQRRSLETFKRLVGSTGLSSGCDGDTAAVHYETSKPSRRRDVFRVAFRRSWGTRWAVTFILVGWEEINPLAVDQRSRDIKRVHSYFSRFQLSSGTFPPVTRRAAADWRILFLLLIFILLFVQLYVTICLFLLEGRDPPQTPCCPSDCPSGPPQRDELKCPSLPNSCSCTSAGTGPPGPQGPVVSHQRPPHGPWYNDTVYLNTHGAQRPGEPPTTSEDPQEAAYRHTNMYIYYKCVYMCIYIYMYISDIYVYIYYICVYIWHM